MQQNAGQAQAMPETEAVPAGKRPGARNERLNVRDFVTIAVLTVLEPLDREALVKILTEPKNSMVRQYQQLFSLDNIELSFDQEALEAIADKAIERKTGARGLRAIIEDVLGNLMYEAPSDCTVAGIRITGACAKGEGEPEYTRDPARRPSRLQISTARRVTPRARRDSAS